GRIEHAANDELRRDRAVPVVRLEAEDDVVPSGPPVPVELRTQPERDRAPRVPAALADAEPEMLAVADGRQVAELARRQQERHARVAKAERREPVQLLTEVEGQLATGDDSVDDRDRAQVV